MYFSDQELTWKLQLYNYVFSGTDAKLGLSQADNHRSVPVTGTNKGGMKPQATPHKYLFVVQSLAVLFALIVQAHNLLGILRHNPNEGLQ